jgi:hypothetical protein
MWMDSTRDAQLRADLYEMERERIERGDFRSLIPGASIIADDLINSIDYKSAVTLNSLAVEHNIKKALLAKYLKFLSHQGYLNLEHGVAMPPNQQTIEEKEAAAWQELHRKAKEEVYQTSKRAKKRTPRRKSSLTKSKYKEAVKTYRQLSPDELQGITDLCDKSDMSYRQIGLQFGISAQVVSRICREAGFMRQKGRGNILLETASAPTKKRRKGRSRKRGRPSLSIRLQKKIRKLCADPSLSYGDIATAAKVSYSTVAKICQEELAEGRGFLRKRGRPKRTMDRYAR